MKLFTLSALCAAALLATTAHAAAVSSTSGPAATDRVSQGTLLAREAESGDDRSGRGRGRDDGKGHRLGDEAPATTIAREAESGDDRSGRGRGRDDGKGHRLSDEAPAAVA